MGVIAPVVIAKSSLTHPSNSDGFLFTFSNALQTNFRYSNSRNHPKSGPACKIIKSTSCRKNRSFGPRFEAITARLWLALMATPYQTATPHEMATPKTQTSHPLRGTATRCCTGINCTSRRGFAHRLWLICLPVITQVRRSQVAWSWSCAAILDCCFGPARLGWHYCSPVTYSPVAGPPIHVCLFPRHLFACRHSLTRSRQTGNKCSTFGATTGTV